MSIVGGGCGRVFILSEDINRAGIWATARDGVLHRVLPPQRAREIELKRPDRTRGAPPVRLNRAGGACLVPASSYGAGVSWPRISPPLYFAVWMLT